MVPLFMSIRISSLDEGCDDVTEKCNDVNFLTLLVHVTDLLSAKTLYF